MLIAGDADLCCRGVADRFVLVEVYAQLLPCINYAHEACSGMSCCGPTSPTLSLSPSDCIIHIILNTKAPTPTSKEASKQRLRSRHFDCQGSNVQTSHLGLDVGLSFPVSMLACQACFDALFMPPYINMEISFYAVSQTAIVAWLLLLPNESGCLI